MANNTGDNKEILTQQVADLLIRQKGPQIQDRSALEDHLKKLAKLDPDHPRDIASQVTRAMKNQSTKRKKTTWVIPVIAALVSVLVLLVIIMASVWGIRRIRTINTPISPVAATQSPTSGESKFVPLPTHLQLNADPAEIPADGSSQTTVTADIRDQKGNPVPNGTQIQFSLSPPDAGRLDPKIAFSRDGKAETTFTPGNQPGEVIIFAWAGQVRTETTITLVGLPRP